MSKKFIYIAAVLLVIGGGIILLTPKFFVASQQQASALPAVSLPPAPQQKDTTLYFVGDIMLDRGVRSSVTKNFGGDYSKLFANVGELKNADILFANLEGDVSDKGNNVGSKYSFRMDPAVLPVIANAGFDIVSFANNHVGDWNVAAFTDTLRRLADNNIRKVGSGMTKTEAVQPTIIEKNGVKFGFIGFSDVGPDWLKATDTTPGLLLASDPNLPQIIQNAKAQCDVLIVSFHWGIEYKTVHNARQEALAHTAIDNGADMVIGHHPHVMEDIETYNGKPIVYSLGNFIFDQPFSLETMRGMLFKATFTGTTLKDTKQEVVGLNKFYQPQGIYDVKTAKEAAALQATEDACPKPKKDYPDYSLLDVGQNVPIPDKTYVPSDLVLLDKSITTKNICMKKDAADAMAMMIAAAKKDGYSIKVSSGYRSESYQAALLKNDIASGNPHATELVAKPGYSEHQLGVAADLTSSAIQYASAATKFQDTKEDDWLEDHAAEYGFVESYPEDKESVTGYMYEAWHYRYVGIDNAALIIKNGQTTNQFLKEQEEEAKENQTTQ